MHDINECKIKRAIVLFKIMLNDEMKFIIMVLNSLLRFFINGSIIEYDNDLIRRH